MTWKTIDSAPKDGTHVVCAAFVNGHVRPEDDHWCFWEDYWRQYLPPYGEGFSTIKGLAPTHWQPLPPPPLPEPVEDTP